MFCSHRIFGSASSYTLDVANFNKSALPSSTDDLVSLSAIAPKKMDLNVELSNVEDLDDRPFKKAKISEPDLLESNKNKNDDDPLPSTTSPTIQSSPELIDEQMTGENVPADHAKTPEEYKQIKIDLEDEQMSEEKAPADDAKQPEEYKQIKVDETYDYLPQDYTMTDLDLCAQIIIETSSEDDILVRMDEIYVQQQQLLCLLDQSKWLNDDVMSAYIHCIRDQVQLKNMDGSKIYFENPFITRLLKRDGSIGIQKDSNFMTETVKNYLKHEMILLPINIKDTHWYLAVINTRKLEIQVLDSLCWENNRADLTITLKGLQYHLDFLQNQQNLIKHDWKDLHVTNWPITEQIQEPIQNDSSSCGLFVLKFMEYWTGETLSNQITQENITLFRYKLAGVLLCWKTNTADTIANSQQKHDTENNPDDVQMLESPYDEQKKTKGMHTISVENKYHSLMSVLSKMGTQELVGGLCDYIRSIKCTANLEKVWVQNSKPYSITLTLKKLQEILDESMPINIDTFNLVIRKIMTEKIQMEKKQRGVMAYHCLDMQFWMITDFGRHPKFRKKLDVERLADSVRSWPGLNYNVAECKMILIPVQFNGGLILFILNKDIRTVYILDSTPLDPIYQYNPNARYTQKLLWVAEHLPKAMSKASRGSRWTENVFLWRQIIIEGIPIYDRELSGYLVSLFMKTWKDEQLQLPFLKDGQELRKQILGQLLTYEDNECEDNMPAGVRELISCIRNSKN